MRIGTRRAAAAVAAIAAGMVLTACTGTAGPVETRASVTASAEATMADTPTPTTDVSHTPPSPPSAMENADIAGAEAAAQYVIAVLNHASTTGDLAEWSRVTSPDCATCVGFTSDIAATGPDPGGAVLVESSKPTEINPGAFYTVALIVNQDAYTRPDGSASEGGRFALLLALRFADTWRVEAIDVGAADAPWAS